MKIDFAINEWISTYQKKKYDWVIDSTAIKDENYDINDIQFTANTTDGPKVFCQEVKSIKGGYQLKYGDNWNNYFSADNPNGITKKMNFDCEDCLSMDDLKGRHIYFVNAADKYGNFFNGKAAKLLKNKALLTFIAPDGMVTFTPKMLKKAIIGYAYYLNKSHTEEFGEKREARYELKAIIDLDMGKYIKSNPPIEFFQK